MKRKYSTKLGLTMTAVLGTMACQSQAQEVRLVVDSVTELQQTSPEPGSEDEIYFNLLGVDGQQHPIQMPQIHPTGYDHWDLSVGRTISSLPLYEGYLANGTQAKFVLTMREADGGFLQAITSVFQVAAGGALALFGSPAAGLSQVVSGGLSFISHLTGDNDQNLGTIAITTEPTNGVLSTQFANVKDTTTPSTGDNEYSFTTVGGGGIFSVRLHLEYNSVPVPMIRSYNNTTGGVSLCMDVPGASTADMVQIQQYAPCHGGPDQRWLVLHQIPSDSTSPVSIVSANSGKCLDVRGASVADGAAIQQYTCHGGPDQQWVIKTFGLPSGYSMLQNVSSSKCIDVPSASRNSGVLLQQFTCGAAGRFGQFPSNQTWAIHP